MFQGAYFEGNFPDFPCPRCRAGVIKARQDTLQKFQSGYSIIESVEDWWDASDEVSKFNLMMICDRQDCGEVVAVLGDVTWSKNPAEVADDGTPIGDGEWEWFLVPKCFNPPLSIVRVPEDTPGSVFSSIRRASWNFWADRRSSANHLRAALECLLDHLNVARKASKANRGYLSLNARIELLVGIDPAHKKIFNALRKIGNLGSHGDEVGRNDLLDCFQLIEYVLDAYFGNRKEKAAAIADSLLSGETQLR